MGLPARYSGLHRIRTGGALKVIARECPQRDRVDLKFQGVRQQEIDEIPVKET
jgi:hypothetical protein